MKKIILLCTFVTMCISSYAQSGDIYEPVAIDPNDLNGDVVMGKNQTKDDVWNSGVQGIGLDSWACFYSENCDVVTAVDDRAHGLPISVNAPYTKSVNIPFNFTWTGNGQFDGRDAIHLTSSSNNVTVKLLEPNSYQGFYFLATLGDAQSGTVTVTVTYTDNTTTTSSFTVNQWYYSGSKPANALQGYYRWHRENHSDHSNEGPCLYCYSFNSSLDQAKQVKSIEFSQSDNNMRTAIFAITGFVSSSIPKCPSNISSKHTSTSTTTITFDKVTQNMAGQTITGVSYFYDVARDPDFKIKFPGHSNQPLPNPTTSANNRVSGTINCDLSGLYIRLRAQNSSGFSRYSNTVKETGTTTYNHTVNVNVNATDAIICSVDGCQSGAKYKSGETITMTASVSALGKAFGYWANNNGTQLSTDNPYTHTVAGDITIHPVVIDEPRTFTIAPGVTAKMGTLAKNHPWLRTPDKPGLAYQSTTNLEPNQESRDTLIITPDQGCDYTISFDFVAHRFYCSDNTSLWINDSLIFSGPKICTEEAYSYYSGDAFLTKPDTIVMSFHRAANCTTSCDNIYNKEESYIYNIKVTSRSNHAPAKPVLTLCSHTNNTTFVTFNEVTKDKDGNPVTGPLTYEYDLARDSGFTEIIQGHKGQSLHVTTSGGVSKGTIYENLSGLYVRIRAKNSHGYSDYSDVITDVNPDIYVYNVVVPDSSRYVTTGNIPGGARYKSGESVTLSATMTRRGMYFKGWADENDDTLSTDNPYTITFPQSTTGSGIQQVTIKPILEIEVREYTIASGVTARMGTLDKDLAWIKVKDEELYGKESYRTDFSGYHQDSRDTLIITPDSGVEYCLGITYTLSDYIDQYNLGTCVAQLYINGDLKTTLKPKWENPYPEYNYDSGVDNLLSQPTTIVMSYQTNDCMPLNGFCLFGVEVSVPYTVTANSNNPDMGSVTGGGEFIKKHQVTLTAHPKPGYIFTEWSNGVTENPYTFTADRDTNITAIFDVFPDFSPLCFAAIDGDVTMRFDIKNIDYGFVYSTDKINWNNYTYNSSINIPNGTNLYFCAIEDHQKAPKAFAKDATSFSQFHFTSNNNGKVDVSGNIMSLYGPSCIFMNELPQWAFYALFKDCTLLISIPDLNQSDKYDLKTYCYNEMFAGCTSLKVNINGPGKTWKISVDENSCYNAMTDMFNGTSGTMNSTPQPNTLYYINSAPTVNVNVDVNNSAWGSVKGGGVHYKRDKATLTATPNQGYLFTGWSNGVTKNSYSFDVDRDTSITAIFDVDPCFMPLCFTAKGGNVTVKFDIKNVTHTIQYSTDKVNWETYTSNTDVTLANDGDKVYFRAETDQTTATAFGDNSIYSQFHFTSDNNGKVEASGNIMSLYGPNFPNLNLQGYAFSSLFRNCSIMTTAPALPATTLAANCYKEMFYGCSSLKVAPELPATTLASTCYSGMFYGCSSLEAAPALTATTLTEFCYSGMFYGCSSLKVAPELPVTTLENGCYANMFDGCSSLKAAPELPATILKERCYAGMFSGCNSLTTYPELPATTMAEFCYSNMFNGCKSLTTLPELHATTLANGCYNYMFYGCSALEINTQAPGIEWSIPANATGGDNLSLSNMFLNTMGTRPETPTKGTTYYVAPYIHFTGAVSSDWNDPQNWSEGELPTDIDNVTIDVPCTVDNNNATCRNLAIIANATLTVNADAVLDVKGKLTSSDTTCLMLKASENSSATVLFASGSPKATVESYIKGSIAPDGENNNPDWQYRGFIGNNYPSTSKPKISGWNVVIFKWDEKKNSTNCWGDAPVYYIGDSYEADPWVGYSMANYSQDNSIYHYTAMLEPTTGSHTYTLTCTGDVETPNRGVNLITNSWSAPIYMKSSDVTFSGNVEQTFYFFKTRDHQEWSADKTGSFVVYPQQTGSAIYGQANSTIPSSQSFLVKATGTGAKLTIGSGALAAQASGPMYAPGERKRLSLLGITISTDSQEDRLFLVESEECSDDFDNGYDGTKIKESGCPQIFAHNAFGNTAVNADSTILGQKIGYSAPADAVQCTISFDAERLSDYSELYLYDRVLKRYADILDGETYTFTGSKEGEKERFEIVGRKNDGSAFVASDNQMVEVTDGRVLLSGFEGSNEMVFITDIAGRRLWSEKSANGPLFDLPTLPAGIYVIYCGNVNCKFIVK